MTAGRGRFGSPARGHRTPKCPRVRRAYVLVGFLADLLCSVRGALKHSPTGASSRRPGGFTLPTAARMDGGDGAAGDLGQEDLAPDGGAFRRSIPSAAAWRTGG